MSVNPVKIQKKPGHAFTTFLDNEDYSAVGVLMDEHTEKHCYPLIKPFLPPHQCIFIQSGEQNKNLDTCYHIWHQLTRHGFDRKALLINLGGGVIGDMGGFCASAYKRGIDFIQMPTTLLSMVDASIGGKLGVDFEGFKNHIGVFKLPVYVFVYTEFLKTLSEREFLSGFAEVIKHCLIYDKAQWHNKIRKSLPAGFEWDELVRHSVDIKSEIVQNDPQEAGLRKILNFGHTLGHAIETFYLENNQEPLLHGEAIAIGMVCESFMSYQKGFITGEDYQLIKNYMLEVFGKVDISEDHFDEIIQLTFQDKKNLNNTVRFSLLEDVGKACFDIPADAKEMQEALRAYQQAEITGASVRYG